MDTEYRISLALPGLGALNLSVSIMGKWRRDKLRSIRYGK